MDVENMNLKAALEHLRLTRLGNLRRLAIAYDRLEEAYIAIGDDCNARSSAAQAADMWSQICKLRAEARTR